MTTISKRGWLTLTGQILVVLSVSVALNTSSAHEPIFGIGPHTIYKGGVGIETEIEGGNTSSGSKKVNDYILHSEIIYGFTADLSGTLSIPIVLERREETGGAGQSSSGLGDASLRIKYRFWRRDRLGMQDSIAFVTGTKLPSGDDDKSPRLGSGSTDFLFGLAAARESLLWYYFGDIRYRLNTVGSGGLKKGDTMFADIAIGIRPWPVEYLKPDLVVLAEVNWERLLRDESDGLNVKDSGGSLVFVSPSFFFTYRNWAVKGGVQIPTYKNLYDGQPEEDYRFKLTVEVHY